MPASDRTAEANRIAGILNWAVSSMDCLEDLFARIEATGLYVRPTINDSGRLHGLRISSPEASITGGQIGLTGAWIEKLGIVYEEARHAAIVKRLSLAHTETLGPLPVVKGRLSATPSMDPADWPSPKPDRDMDPPEKSGPSLP